MLHIFKILLLLKIINIKVDNGVVKKSFNPYNFLSYICIIIMFIVYLFMEIIKAVVESFRIFFSKNLFKYH